MKNRRFQPVFLFQFFYCNSIVFRSLSKLYILSKLVHTKAQETSTTRTSLGPFFCFRCSLVLVAVCRYEGGGVAVCRNGVVVVVVTNKTIVIKKKRSLKKKHT
jgi:hypothetical protein